MKDLIGKHLFKATVFGIIMTIIGFFNGQTVFTFPPVWLDLLKLFLIYTGAFLIVYVLCDWIYEKFKKD